MKDLIRLVTFAFGTLLAHAALAQPPAASAPAKPANATGQCKDGTYWTDATKSGACRGHHGVKDWYLAAAPATTPAAAKSSPAAKAAPAAKPAPAAAPAPPTPAAATPQPRPQTPAPAPAAAPTQAAAPAAKKGPKANLASTPVAPGGGPGLVWVNTSTNVYHCPGTDFYGKTKAGSYMSESDAKGKGARADHGKACTK